MDTENEEGVNGQDNNTDAVQQELSAAASERTKTGSNSPVENEVDSNDAGSVNGRSSSDAKEKELDPVEMVYRELQLNSFCCSTKFPIILSA